MLKYIVKIYICDIPVSVICEFPFHIHTYILYCYLPKGAFRNNDYITLFIITDYNTDY